MELNIGDKVLLKPLGECKKTPLWISGIDMNSHAGSVVTVREVDITIYGRKFFRIEGCRWAFSIEAIEKKIDADLEPTPKDNFELLFGFAD